MWAFFIALALFYLYSIRISFSFYCAASVLSPSYSFLCSVFLYAFIISLCPWIYKSLFIWESKVLFNLFIFCFCIILNSLCLSPFFPPSITWFSLLHIFENWSTSLFQNSWFSVLSPTTYVASSSNNWLNVLLPPANRMYVGFFQNCEILKFNFKQGSNNYNTYIGVDTSAKILKPSTDMYPVLYLSAQWKKRVGWRFGWRKAKEKTTESVQVK